MRVRKPDQPCYIYIIAASNSTIKIGVARRPGSRLRDLQTACPLKLELFASYQVDSARWAFPVEQMAHKRLRRFRLQGEWFGIAPAQAAALVTAIISGRPKNINADLEIASALQFPAPRKLICPHCHHTKNMKINAKLLWRGKFRCTSCQQVTEGRRLFIRRVA